MCDIFCLSCEKIGRKLAHNEIKCYNVADANYEIKENKKFKAINWSL